MKIFPETHKALIFTDIKIKEDPFYARIQPKSDRGLFAIFFFGSFSDEINNVGSAYPSWLRGQTQPPSATALAAMP